MGYGLNLGPFLMTLWLSLHPIDKMVMRSCHRRRRWRRTSPWSVFRALRRGRSLTGLDVQRRQDHVEANAGYALRVPSLSIEAGSSLYRHGRERWQPR